MNADLLWPLFGQCLLLSLLAIGGAVSTAPEMHRYLVGTQHWLTDAQFTDSVALAQAAPGPNLLFIAVLGWNVAGPLGVVAAMSGILLPSSTIAWAATRWGQRRPDHPAVRVFTNGLTPLTVGLLLSTGWVLAQPARASLGGLALVAITAALSARTRVAPVLLIAAGGVAGAFGLA